MVCRLPAGGKEIRTLGPPGWGGLNCDSPKNGKTPVISIYYGAPCPMGFVAEGLEGRIGDPKAGWKGRELWTTSATARRSVSRGATRRRRSRRAAPAGVPSSQPFDLTGVAAVRGGAADRVGGLDADRQINVGAVGAERVVAGQVQFGASLPATTRAVPGQRRVEACSRPHAAARGRDRRR